jgi:branched-chain amino acid transport system permease protein
MRSWRSSAFIGLAVVLVCAFFASQGHYFASSIVLGGIYTIAVLGLVVLTGLTGQISLGHGAFVGIGAYTTAILTERGLQPWLGCIAGVLLAAAVAALLAVPLVRLKGHLLALATLAVGLIALSVFNGWSGVTLGPSGITSIAPIRFGPIAITGESANFVFVWGLALVCLLGSVNLWSSPFGRAALAVKRDEAAAAAMGINVAWVKIQVFTLSSAFAGLSGALYAHYVSFIAPDRFGLNASFELLLGALLGGIVSPYGAVAGSAFLMVLPDIVSPLQDYKVFFYGAVFIAVSLYLPRGLLGIFETAGGALKRLWIRPPAPSGAVDKGVE